MAQLHNLEETATQDPAQGATECTVHLAFDSHERILLDDAAAVFGYTADTLTTDLKGILKYSSWAKDVTQALSAIIYDGDIKINTQQDTLHTWNRLVSLLDGTKGKSSIFRMHLF